MGDPGRGARIGATTPIGRAGTPEEIAEAILWLLTPQASYVTGAILDVDRRPLTPALARPVDRRGRRIISRALRHRLPGQL